MRHTQSKWTPRSVLLLVTIPVKLESAPITMTKRSRSVLMEAWNLRLRADVPGFDWSIVQLSASPATPYSVREKKNVCVRGEMRDTRGLLADAERLLTIEGLRVRGAKSGFLYYDWGLASLELELELSVTNLSALARCVELGNKVYEYVLENSSTVWVLPDIDNALGALTKKSPRPQEKQLQQRESGAKLLDNYCVGIVAEGPPSLDPATREELGRLSSVITGSISSGREAVACESVWWVAAGFGGQFIIQDANHASYSYDLDRIRWMLRLISLYWGALWETSHQLSQLTTQLVSQGARATEDGENWTSRLAQVLGINETVSRDLIYIDRKILSTEAFIHELSPRALSAYPLDEQVYSRVWLAWNGEDLLREVRGQLTMHREFFSGRVAARTSRSQERINLILFVLNVLMFSTVVTAVIDVYDVDNSAITPNYRLALVVLATACFFTASLSFLLRRR